MKTLWINWDFRSGYYGSVIFSSPCQKYNQIYFMENQQHDNINFIKSNGACNLFKLAKII